MSEIFPFFIVLAGGLVFSKIFRRFHVPWTVALIASGIIIGPSGLKIIEPDTTLEFLKYLGLVFLMFMAGLETRFSGFREVWKEASFIGLVAGAIPFCVGILIGIFLGYDLSTVVFLGTLFIASSIAIAVPALEGSGLFHSRLGKIITSSILLQDIASLVLLAIVLQYFIPGTLPPPVFITLFALAFLATIGVRWGIPRLRKIFGKDNKERGRFESDLRVVFAVLVGTVIIFELLGLHAIVGAFLAGLVLSEVIQEKALKEKMHVMAYGLFIPVFFVMIGIDTNIGLFVNTQNVVFLVLLIVSGSIIAKFFSGWLSARLLGFTSLQSSLVGGACIPKLSTTLAIIAVGQKHNILPEELSTTLIILSIVTIFVSSIIMEKTASKIKESYFVTRPE